MREPETSRMEGARQLNTLFSNWPMLKPWVFPEYRGRRRRKSVFPPRKVESCVRRGKSKISPSEARIGSGIVLIGRGSSADIDEDEGFRL